LRIYAVQKSEKVDYEQAAKEMRNILRMFDGGATPTQAVFDAAVDRLPKKYADLKADFMRLSVNNRGELFDQLIKADQQIQVSAFIAKPEVQEQLKIIVNKQTSKEDAADAIDDLNGMEGVESFLEEVRNILTDDYLEAKEAKEIVDERLIDEVDSEEDPLLTFLKEHCRRADVIEVFSQYIKE